MLQESCAQPEVTILHLDGGPCYAYFLTRNQDAVSRLYHHLIVPPLFLYPLPSLISNCLNPPFGTQGRSRRLKEAYILRIRNAEHRTDLYSGAPQRPAQF